MHAVPFFFKLSQESATKISHTKLPSIKHALPVAMTEVECSFGLCIF